MTTTVGMFPGLGADYPQMAARYLSAFPEDARFVRRWELILGIRFCDESLTDAGDQGIVNQYRIHALNLLWWQRCGESFRPDIVCGHSMGFYSALVAAGALRADDSFRLIGTVFSRALSVLQAGHGVVCVITSHRPFVEDALRDAGLEVLSVNNAMQCVVYADAKILRRYIESAGETLLSCAYLETGIPFHSNKLGAIERELSDYIDRKIPIKTPKIPLVSHITGEPVTSKEDVKWHLVNQPHLPVHWLNMVKRLIAGGAGEFVEIGPNRILTQMVKWIDPHIPIRFVDSLRKKTDKKTARATAVGGAVC